MVGGTAVVGGVLGLAVGGGAAVALVSAALIGAALVGAALVAIALVTTILITTAGVGRAIARSAGSIALASAAGRWSGAAVRSQQIPGVVEGLDLVLGFLVQPLIVLGNAIGMPNEY